MLWGLGLCATAQTSVSGRVFDGKTGAPLPFVNVAFAGTAIGTMTDVQGMYTLDAGTTRVTRISYSSLGYQNQTISIQRGVPQVINVSLEARSIDLEAAVIRPDKKAVNPAKPLMQRVADAKENNDPAKIPALHHQFYEIMEVAINDFPDRWPLP